MLTTLAVKLNMKAHIYAVKDNLWAIYYIDNWTWAICITV